MNKDDKFIKEKLDLVNQIDTDEEVPDSLIEKCHALALSLPPKTSTPKRSKSRWIVALSSCSVVLTAILVLCIVFIPTQNDDSFYYHDEDLQTYLLSYDEMIADYDFLLPERFFYDAAYFINKDKKTQVPVYSTMEFAFEDGDMEVTVVLVNNYVFTQYDLYENHVTKPAETALFSYEYGLFDGLALAKCEYNGYKYYLRYTSDYPEDICDIMSSFTI